MTQMITAMRLASSCHIPEEMVGVLKDAVHEKMNELYVGEGKEAVGGSSAAEAERKRRASCGERRQRSQFRAFRCGVQGFAEAGSAGALC